ncbi:sporulation peptidase YabG [Bacillus horti]|uniref:Spore coat assembly protein n=1 Tax=Caldalkalibacillus horti TaxID=77523 RepID=A0ABT9W2T7_9BACI|nr:sporulation peptidase YabG [Bacillus horti]MDQ0167571.1 spore coat assembly protein [Bacillus horti]
MSFKVGDIVGRKSYQVDIHFRIIAIDHKTQEAELKGIDMRLFADAPLEDLVRIDDDTRDKLRELDEQRTSSSVEQIKQDRESSEGEGDGFFELPGRVLHMDGDANYLKKCMEVYRELNIPVYGIHMPEKEMPDRVTELLNQLRPEILIMTGHDAYSKTKGERNDLKAYRHSSYFCEAVKLAREYERHRDNLIIFAGACQSHFEALISSGANFASSPERVNIHALDPVFIVEKACYTSIDQIINVKQILHYSVTGSSGLGGIDTRGTYRMGKPKLK